MVVAVQVPKETVTPEVEVATSAVVVTPTIRLITPVTPGLVVVRRILLLPMNPRSPVVGASPAAPVAVAVAVAAEEDVEVVNKHRIPPLPSLYICLSLHFDPDRYSLFRVTSRRVVHALTL